MDEINNCVKCEFQSFALEALSSDELLRHQQNCTVVHFKHGESLFKQGMLSSHIIYIKSGLVKIHEEVNKKEYIVKVVKAPTYLGFGNTFGDKVFKFSATALEATESCLIDVNVFKDLIQKNGSFAYQLLTSISKDELAMVRRFTAVSSKQVMGRVAEALLFFADDIYSSHFFELPFTRVELASYVNATRESATRVLLEMKRDGIIQLNGKSVTILKYDFLKSLIEKA